MNTFVTGMEQQRNKDTERLLFVAIKNGDKRAFDTLFGWYYVDLVMFCGQFICDREDAEDVVQGLFMKLWEQREEIQVPDSVKSYLVRSAQNACLNMLHHRDVRMRYRSEYLSILPYRLERGADELLLYSDLSRLLAVGESELNEKELDVWTLSCHEELKYAEIAVRLGISVRTVENRMASAKRKIRIFLSRHWPLIVLFCFAGSAFNY